MATAEQIQIIHPMEEPGWGPTGFLVLTRHCDAIGVVAFHQGTEANQITLRTGDGDRLGRVVGIRYSHGIAELDVVGWTADDIMSSHSLYLRDQQKPQEVQV